MAVSANALTLAQWALQSNNPLVIKIAYSLLENASVLMDIPLYTKKTLFANGVRWQNSLPSVNWGKINTDPVVTSGTPTPFQEQVYLVRNAIDVDRKLIEDENRIQDPRGVQMGAYLKALTYDVNDKFINNDHVSGNTDAPVGLRSRITNYSTFGVNSDMAIDCGGVIMDDSGSMTAIQANKFLEYIQQLLDYMGAPDGDGVVLYMNDYMKRRIAVAVRLLGAGAGFTMLRDAFDRPVQGYMQAKIKDIGRKADQTTRIITNTENADGTAGSSNYTSIYGVRYGEDYCYGWQFDELERSIEDIGLIGNGGTVYRTVIDYALGLMVPHTRAIGRLYDIKIK